MGDTTGYKPDELKVTAGEGVVMIEARHEERSEQGQVMVSRHMKRSYPLPASSQPHQRWCPRHHCPQDQDNQTTIHGCPNQHQIKLLIRISSVFIANGTLYLSFSP